MLINLCVTSEIFSRGTGLLGTRNRSIFFNKMLSIRKGRLLITSRYIAMQSYECVIQERRQKGDSGCASEKLGVPHLLSD